MTLIDGGTQRLPRIVGYGNAIYPISTGCRIDASRTEHMGLVQEVVESGQAATRTLQLAQDIAALPQPALVADRAGVNASTEQHLSEGLLTETRIGRAIMDAPEVVERLADYRANQSRHTS